MTCDAGGLSCQLANTVKIGQASNFCPGNPQKPDRTPGIALFAATPLTVSLNQLDPFLQECVTLEIMYGRPCASIVELRPGTA